MNIKLKYIPGLFYTRKQISQLKQEKSISGKDLWVKGTQRFTITDWDSFTSLNDDGYGIRTFWSKLRYDFLILANLFTHQKTEGVCIDINFMCHFFGLVIAIFILGVL